MVDTSKADEMGLWTMYRKHDHLGITGYMQPQSQIAREKGARSYNAGNFPDQSNSRFMLRRGRFRFGYAHFTDEGLPVAQVVFQFDGTEQGYSFAIFMAGSSKINSSCLPPPPVCSPGPSGMK